MGRGSRSTEHAHVAAAAGQDLRGMLRGRPSDGRAGWVVAHEIEGAPAAIAAADLRALSDLTRMVNQGAPAPERVPDLYVAAAAALMDHVDQDPDAALAYAHALKHNPAAGHHIACNGLIGALSKRAVEDAGRAPIGPKHIISDMLWKSGASASTSSVYEEAVAVEQQAALQLQDRAFGTLLSVPTDVPVTYQTLQSAAQDELAKRTAAALHSRLARTPVMYGVWIRRRPGSRLPDVEQLHQALTAAAHIDDRGDAVDAFRRRLSEIAR